MAKLTSGQRSRMSAATFAIPETRSYPIPDESHARDALARASGKSVEGRVKAAVRRKFPDIKVS